MVTFRDDIDTFCKYIAHRPPNVDRTVYQHLEDRHLERGMRGLYYIARYDHQSEDGAVITVGLDQFCGGIDLADDAGTDMAAAGRIEAVEQRLCAAAAGAGGMIRKEPIRYTGEVVPPPG